uniref:GumC family protein n=1 Tax=uncultured Sphingomonas sp. TaxID=158754 RepID=UPI002589BA45|nr:polysaccharide biosynthesis tyrosine autokinase [uncultured Sphingomonas sp.]
MHTLPVNAQPNAAIDPPTTPDLARDPVKRPALVQYMNAVKRWKWVIAAIFGTCLILGAVVTLLMPPKYSAMAQLEISREQKQITNVQGIESEQAGRDVEFYATQYALLRARPLAERVSRDLRLVTNREFFVAHGVESYFVERPNRNQRFENEKLIVNLLLKNIAVDPVRTSRLVNLTYTSRSPQLSADLANNWAKAFIASSIDRQFASTLDARRVLESRLTALKARLEQSERQVVAYAQQQDIVALEQSRDVDGRTKASRTLTAADLEALNDAVNRAVEARVLAQSRAASNPDVAGEAVTNPTLAALREQRATAVAEQARLSVQFEPGYPAASEARQKVRALDEVIARETQRIRQARQQEYAEAQKRENELRSQVQALTANFRAQQRANIQYTVYQREADTNRQLYDALLQRYKEIGVAGTIGANNIAITEPALVPSKPSSPKLFLNLAIALMAAVVLSAGLVFALEQIDEGIRDPAQVPRDLALPLLGHTPLLADSNDYNLNDTKSPVYEAYFSIRSNLSFTTSHGFPKSLMVTSTRPSEGKTSTALALAVILGRTGKRILLIDSDMRSPSIHRLVGARNDAGLSNILAGQDDWQSLVLDTTYRGLAVIPAGPTPPSAAELLSGQKLGAFVSQCLEVFDHVVIDSPPVLGLADAPLISQGVEGCVFVVEAAGAPLRAVRASVSRMRMAHAHLFGAILTKLDQRSDSGYGYGYGYGQTYGASQRTDHA